MKIYEMTFSMGLVEEQRSLLYFDNTIITRKNFVSKMECLIYEELDTVIKLQKDSDIIYLFEHIYYETCSYLEKMSDNFISYGSARIDESIFLLVEEKIVINF